MTTIPRAISATDKELRETDGFVVESSDGDVGWVEEIWLGEASEPRALAVQTTDGRHALLLGEDVVTVDREQRWVVVSPESKLLELAAPRLRVNGDAGRPDLRMTALWATTGAALDVEGRPSWHWRLRLPRRRQPTRTLPHLSLKRPVWQSVALLLVVLAFIVSFVITLAFAVARLVTGSAY
jgi:hypothetical protein